MTFVGLKNRILAAFIAAALALAAMYVTVPAATTIKTQKAADRIEGGIRGIDVSKYQGDINWSKVAQDNVKFAIIRASVGVILSGKYQLNDDPMFVKNATEAHKNGLKVGAYHYACLTSHARVQSEAKAFLKQLKQVKITYPVVIDVESNPGKLSRAALTELTKAFADTVSAQGYTVMIYSYQNFIRDHLDVSKLGNYKLWVANYNETPKSITHSMWQHTSSGRVSGISGNVDINIQYPDFQPKRWKSASVSKAPSDAIKERLRTKYKLKVPQSGLQGIHELVVTALQMELNKQMGKNIAVNGMMDREALQALASIKFGSGTKGNITYLVQARLFYLGFYKVEPSGEFDGRTNEALRDFQYAKGLNVNGMMNQETVYTLFG